MRKTSEDYCQGEKTFFFGKVGSMSQRLIVDYVNVWCLTMLWMFGKPMIRYLINMVGVSLSQYEVPFKSIGFLPTSIISHAVCGCHPHCLMWCNQFSSFNPYHFWFCKHWSSKWDPEVAPFLYQMHHVRGLQIQSPTSYMMIFQDWQIPPKMNYHFPHFSTNWVLTSRLKLQTKTHADIGWRPSGLQADVSVENRLGARKSAILAWHVLHGHPALGAAMAVMKSWAKRWGRSWGGCLDLRRQMYTIVCNVQYTCFFAHKDVTQK